MVLGCILMDPEAVHKVTDLRDEYFYDPIHREVYAAMCQLRDANEPIDPLLLSRKLGEQSKIHELGGIAFLLALTEKVPSSSIVDKYAQIIVQCGIKRDYMAAARAILSDACTETMSAADVQAHAEQKLLSVGDQKTLSQFTTIETRADDWYENFAELRSLTPQQREARRVRTGLPSLDAKVTLRPGNMVILAGRPAMGKTALALNLVLNACQQQKSVGFFSYEMTANEIMDRIVSNQLGIDSRTLEEESLDEATYTRIGDVLKEIHKYQLYMDNNADRSLSTLVSRARRLKQLYGIDLLVIDYLQLVYTTEKFAQQSRLQMTSHVSNTIKTLAIELDIPILVMSQLSRNCENRPNKEPQLSDLRESGEIEQDADIVMMIYRDDYYEEESDRPNVTDVFVRKNRMGDNARVELHFNRQYQQFRSIDHAH